MQAVVNAVAEVVSDVVESAGNAAQDGLDAAADGLREHVPFAGTVLGGLLRWLGRSVSATLDLVAAVIKGGLGIAGCALGGALRIGGGIRARDGELIVGGFLDIPSGLAGAVVLIGGQAIVLLQTITLLQAMERRLTEAESALLERVFRGSVALYNIRIVEGRAGVFSLNDRPFCCGNTIYLKGRDTSARPGLLVHEVCHVWQFQNRGARYAIDALGAHALLDDPYDWEAEIARGHSDWGRFNEEAQAELLEDIWVQGKVTSRGIVTAIGNGVFYDADGTTLVGRFDPGATDRTALANEAVRVVRNAESLRLSAAWS